MTTEVRCASYRHRSETVVTLSVMSRRSLDGCCKAPRRGLLRPFLRSSVRTCRYSAIPSGHRDRLCHPRGGRRARSRDASSPDGRRPMDDSKQSESRRGRKPQPRMRRRRIRRREPFSKTPSLPPATDCFSPPNSPRLRTPTPGVKKGLNWRVGVP